MPSSRLALAALVVFVPLVSFAAASDAATRAAAAARADIQKTIGFVPVLFDAASDAALPGAWAEMKAVQMNPATTLSARTKELVGLAVAAQIPCTYCTYAHTSFARAHGATPDEIEEAVAIGANARHMSTLLHGLQIDEAEFRRDVSRMLAAARRTKTATPPSAPSAAPTEPADAKAAFADAERRLGFVPGFLRKLPDEAVPGVWRLLRDLEMSPTALSDRDKALISLGVAAQMPCRYCVVADTEFARAAGATDDAIGEAVVMASIVRFWSTALNGTRVDEARFRAEIDRMAAAAARTADAR